jgi:hypothetical protein
VDADLAERFPALADVTVEQLLGMTGGIPGYSTTGIIALRVMAEPLSVGTDLTDWNASYGQIGGGMHSTVADLGIMQLLDEVGHEGEAIGWEGWAGRNPETGVSAVVFTNTCADSGALFSALSVIDPAFSSAAQGS